MLLEKKKKNTFVAENAENTEGEMLEWINKLWKKQEMKHLKQIK